jgi:hypothetical protein
MRERSHCAFAETLPTYDVKVNIAFWSCAIVTAASAGVSFGFAAASLKAAKADVKTGLMYAFARSLALLAAGIVALFTNSVPFVAAVAVAMIIVQAADAIIGIQIHDRVKTAGPAVTGATLSAERWPSDISDTSRLRG